MQALLRASTKRLQSLVAADPRSQRVHRASVVSGMVPRTTHLYFPPALERWAALPGVQECTAPESPICAKNKCEEGVGWVVMWSESCAKNNGRVRRKDRMRWETASHGHSRARQECSASGHELPYGAGPSLPRNEGRVLGELRAVGLTAFHGREGSVTVSLTERDCENPFSFQSLS